MRQNYRIYLDACCLNRPFDDRSQPRIALEIEAILTILSRCETGQWLLISSTALDVELNRIPNLERLRNVKSLLALAKIRVLASQFIETRSRELQTLGFAGFDATHIASAERGRADIFLSTDDRLVKKARRNIQLLDVAVDNPVQWLMTTTQAEDGGDA